MTATLAISPQFARRILDLHSARGKRWLKSLPGLIAASEQRWALTVMSPFKRLSYNYVAPAVRSDGSEVVLKIGIPHPELLTEIEALRLYDGRGAVRLLDADADQGILLLERLRPGTPLTKLPDDEQTTAIAATIMRQLWRPVPAGHPFPTVAKWAQGLKRLRRIFAGATGPLPEQLVDRAERLFAELIPCMAEPVVLHGDLHHDNILTAERQAWLALDPKGVVGEPAYEVGAFLRNPMPQIAIWPQLDRTLARRIDQFAEILNLDRQRITGWALAQAVLSAVWSLEDEGYGWEPAIACAEALASLSRS